MSRMQRIEYTVHFVTPAFLGGADQSAQWRTPPFKALLRQWWRVVYAGDHRFDVNVADMRREEGLLFGNAWLSHRENGREVADHCKSLVRLRLDRWEGGQLTKWDGLEQSSIFHPEVQRTNYKVGPHAYLGYGPLDGRGNTRLSEKANAAIQAGELATVSIAVPDEYAVQIGRVLALMSRFGTLGSRGRNGWGSFLLEGADEASEKALELARGKLPLRDWRECLHNGWDWPHAIGQDDQGALIWQTANAYTDWKLLMRDLAIIKIGLRTQFIFPSVKPPHATVEPRHWLSYPITIHTTRVWKPGVRLPNTLRFKVCPDSNDEKKLRGVIFHVPCLPAPEFKPDPTEIKSTWHTVHALLDHLCITSGRHYTMVANSQRRAALKSQLDSVTLQRIPE